MGYINILEGKRKEIFTIFISSTIEDENKLLRQNIKERLEIKEHIKLIMSEYPETFPKTIDPNMDTFEASKDAVKYCDIFALIINKRYGNIEPKGELSILELESNEADKLKIPKIVFIENDVLKDFQHYEKMKKQKWDREKKKNNLEGFLEILEQSGYDNPKKLMNFISKISKKKLAYSDHWFWKFSINKTDDFYKDLDAQIEFYISQIKGEWPLSLEEKELFNQDPINISISKQYTIPEDNDEIIHYNINIKNNSDKTIKNVNVSQKVLDQDNKVVLDYSNCILEGVEDLKFDLNPGQENIINIFSLKIRNHYWGFMDPLAGDMRYGSHGHWEIASKIRFESHIGHKGEDNGYRTNFPLNLKIKVKITIEDKPSIEKCFMFQIYGDHVGKTFSRFNAYDSERFREEIEIQKIIGTIIRSRWSISRSKFSQMLILSELLPLHYQNSLDTFLKRLSIEEGQYVISILKKISDFRKRIELIKDNKKSISCIRCGVTIPFDFDYPYCINCYKVWAIYKNREFKEKHCHECGKFYKTTINRPLCIECHREWEDYFIQ